MFSFLAIIQDSKVVRFNTDTFTFEGEKVEVWYQEITSGTSIMRPGLKFHLDEGSTITDKMNFISLMLALFLGTASLPHVLIRYYTVATPRDARKSTIVAIAAIGFFYVLTLYMGLCAMISGVIDPQSGNMSAPLLAKSFGTVLFAIISAIAFATVLGTVSGLIVASAGAVAHDLMTSVLKIKFTDKGKVFAGKIAAISVGIVAALTIIMLSPSMIVRFGLEASSAPWTLENPAIIAVPLSFLALIVVSLLTQKQKKTV